MHRPDTDSCDVTHTGHERKNPRKMHVFFSRITYFYFLFFYKSLSHGGGVPCWLACCNLAEPTDRERKGFQSGSGCLPTSPPFSPTLAAAAAGCTLKQRAFFASRLLFLPPPIPQNTATSPQPPRLRCGALSFYPPISVS